MAKAKTKNRAVVKRTPLDLTRRVLDISVTERAQFKLCRRQWELEVLENLGQRIPLGQFLEFGSGMHEALEAYYIAKSLEKSEIVLGYPKPKPLMSALSYWDNWYERSERRLVEDPELVEEAKAALLDDLYEMGDFGEEMIRSYHQYAKQEDTFNVHAVEGVLSTIGKSWLKKHHDEREWIGEVASENGVVLHESGRLLCPILDPKTNSPLPGKPMLSAKIDLLAHRSDEGMRGLWIYDHKTSDSAPNDRGLDFFDQVTAYCYIVWRWLGIVPRGVCMNYLIKKIPKEPRQLKSGALSTAKDQLTTPARYRQELIERGLMLKDGTIESEKHAETYEALLSRAWSPFFQRHYATRSVFELRSFEQRLYYEYMDMLDVYEEVAEPYPNFGPPHMSWCTWCRVAPICQAIEDGSDVDSIIDERYMQKPDRKAVKHW